MLSQIKLPAYASDVPRPILALLAILALVAVAVPTWLVATTPRVLVHKPPKVVLATRIVPKTEVPEVDPVVLQAVAPTDAKEINALVPFSDEANPAARAFNIYGSPDSQARAVDCLAAAVYYEAGDDAVGQKAVAQVVLNRMRHPAFPKTVCGVVFQGWERTTGCQFSFTCDGAMFRYKPSAAGWNRARALANMALHGSVDARVGHATHYHTDWVVPYWSARLEKITAVHGKAGTHLFFRWTGWWGTPAAFNRPYTGVEPNIARMTLVSPSFSGDPGAPPGEVLPLTPEAPIDPLAAADPASIKASDVPAATPADGNSFLVTLPKGMSPNDFASLAVRTCGDRPYCKFMAWTDPSKTPAKLPLSSAQVASMSFSFMRDERQGYFKALWNCGQFPRPVPVQCMRGQPLAAPVKPVVEPALPATEGRPAVPGGLTGVRRKGDDTPPTGLNASGGPRQSMTIQAPRPVPSPSPKPTPTPVK